MEMKIEIAPDGLRWSVLPPLRVSAQQQLALIWYEFDSNWKVWRAMWGVSGLVSPDRPVVSYLTASRLGRCIATDAGTQYRAELYLDGRLVAQATDTPVANYRFKPLLLSDLNIALCAPTRWTEVDVPQHSENDGMLVRALGTDTAYPCDGVLYVLRL